MSLYDTSSSTVARHWQTQLALSVAFLKQLNGPIRLEDLALRSGVESLLHNHELVEGLKKHERVRYTEKTGLFAYKVRLHSCAVVVSTWEGGLQCDIEAERSSSHFASSTVTPSSSPTSSCPPKATSSSSCDDTLPKAACR
jgi:hypothetical protein